MPSTYDHSSGSESFSSPRSGSPGTTAETDPLADLIDHQAVAMARLIEITNTPQYQAAMAELAAQSARAADAFFTFDPLTSGSKP